MSLNEFIRKIKSYNKLEEKELFILDTEGNPLNVGLFSKIFLSLFILLISILSFGLGRLSKNTTNFDIVIKYDPKMTLIENNEKSIYTGAGKSEIQSLPKANSNFSGDGLVIASKNGSKYHHIHCPGAKQIKEENKIEFASARDAEASGYTLAGNCKPK